MKTYLVSLGCPKNLTDTEVIMGNLALSGHEITTDPAEAETIIVNTCAFLKTARDEAIQTIKEMAKWKKNGKCKQLLIAGCFVKYLNSSLGISHSSLNVDGAIDSLGLFNYGTPRLKATPPWTAYVKIAEGCDNACSYCLIPKIRGRFRHREIADILKEAEMLVDRGVKEVIFIAEDTAAYPDLAGLLCRTAKIDGLRWLRLLYTYPSHLTDEAIEVIATEKKIVKYLDLPIQHACDRILKLMNRPELTGRDLEKFISQIRRRIPKIALRTTVIVGFPGEGEAEFEELIGFIRRVKFNRLGGFTYQRENGTVASKMRGQLSERKKAERLKRLMRVQAGIARELNNKMIDQTMEILIERVVRGGFVGRSSADAPEIDGSVLVKSNKILKPGEFVRARITGAKAYDLFGSSA
ncbi:ribosomal protein S12 methylthiotransferase RimO [candidate division WOR-1 bacterium RIFCSPHIGHO2_01_FULL_53_15]|uniref:Ribosomal protein uS12 methylthiotransferase RimO n=1 Tax=candidate division WOR-1 bacterium RIFCSPHIGHO2_01_FULL_53_15 TaxID=1802564 RepID=A0A1F4Q258_UNCSA|nr:MAG: ribosomal protein S12 methylthiotransferase RimO [candidate division WOR-1 bacterium RIFCSPHIGHO2_01_FULL_53_15]OGC13633.1 MAG: ribosomal protein S12 methylthiotransferase RimO [candidate division WOR-1 bacterium RIFCSPHIGHO2_02_FULL_53_26]